MKTSVSRAMKSTSVDVHLSMRIELNPSVSLEYYRSIAATIEKRTNLIKETTNMVEARGTK